MADQRRTSVPRAPVTQPMLVFVAVALGTVAAGVFYYSTLRNHAWGVVTRDLLSVSQLKIRQIADWRSDLQLVGLRVQRNPFISEAIEEYLSRPEDDSLAGRLEHFLGGYTHLQDVQCVEALLLDTIGRILARHTRASEHTADDTLHLCAYTERPAQYTQPLLTDFHLDADQWVHLSLLVPIHREARDELPVVATLLLRIDPAALLYPLVQTWPTASPTAEVLMGRRDGDSIIYLNDLRFRPGAALAYKLPLHAPGPLLLAQAALGATGIVEGRDYRGTPVIGAVGAIEGSPWLLVVKVAKSEVFENLRRQTILTATIVLALLTAMFFALAAFWRRQQARLELIRRGEMEQAIREQTASLRASNQELESFAYSVSHDLRTPLRSIDGFTQAIVEDHGNELGSEARRHLSRVRSAAQRMGELIDDLLRLSTIARAALVKESVDVSAMCAEIVAALRAADPTRRVQVTVAPGMNAWADPHLLRVALDNLLSNAWKYTGKTSNALIEVASSSLPTGRTAIRVRDNGAGFDMAFAHKLFRPFQRLHQIEDYPGSGIGLSLVQRVVDRHGGLTHVEAAPGKGASFTIELPTPAARADLTAPAA